MPDGLTPEERERERGAVTARTRFMATLSHELRTPLHGLLGFLDLLDSERPTEDWRELVRGARGCARQIRVLVEDFVDLASVDAGIEVVTAPFSIRRCVEEVRAATAAAAAAKSLSLIVDVHPAVPDRVAGDRARVQQVLANLVACAVALTPRGRVRLRVRPGAAGLVLQPATTLWFDESDPTYVGVVEFEVEDDGHGVAAEQLARLFEPTEPGGSARLGLEGRTRLELPYSRRLARAMGGDLTVTSQEGIGTTFRLHVAFSAAEPSVASLSGAPAPSPSGPLSVLLADDNAVNRLVGRQILESLGHRVDVAEDGSSALQLTAEHTYDVVVMDMEMPNVDGLEATRRLRQRGYESPILGFTAHSDCVSTNRCHEAGMNAVIHKPLSVEKLDAALGHMMSGRFGWREARERAQVMASLSAPRRSRSLRAPPAPQRSPRESVAETSALFSFADLCERVGGDVEAAKEILVATVADSARLMEEIDSALAHRDLDTLRRAAHSLKGCVANVSAEALVERALAVERAAEARDESACVEGVPQLRAVFDRVFVAMEAVAGGSSAIVPAHEER